MGNPSEGGYSLKFISGKYQGGEFPLKANQQIVVGRSSELDMVLVEDMVSRKHAKISVSGNSITIEDLGSTNGTFVNGEKVQTSRLKEGDRILIGTSILKLVHSANMNTSIDSLDVKQQLESLAAKQAARHSKTAMTGKLEEVPLPDLLQLFHTSKKSGVLVVQNEQEGKIYLRLGRVFYACIGDRHEVGPKKSFNRMITWEHGQFELSPSDGETFDVELDDSTEALLMDALRQLDEYRRIAPQLPSLHGKLKLSKNPQTPWRELEADQLDLLQLVVQWETLHSLLENSVKDDSVCAQMVIDLIQKGVLLGDQP